VADEKQRLEIAEAALAELEEQLGAPFQSLRTASAIEAYLLVRTGTDPESTLGLALQLVEAADNIDLALYDGERRATLAADGDSPAQQLVTLSADLVEAYGALTNALDAKGVSLSVYGTYENAIRELMVHTDLLPYVERLRARFPGHNDRMVAQSIFHFERRGGELLALDFDSGVGDVPAPERL